MGTAVQARQHQQKPRRRTPVGHHIQHGAESRNFTTGNDPERGEMRGGGGGVEKSRPSKGWRVTKLFVPLRSSAAGSRGRRTEPPLRGRACTNDVPPTLAKFSRHVAVNSVTRESHQVNAGAEGDETATGGRREPSAPSSYIFLQGRKFRATKPYTNQVGSGSLSRWQSGFARKGAC